MASPKRRPFPPDALQIVIAQADTNAADPIDDPDGYQEAAHRKKEELRKLLSAGIGKRSIPIHVVAADPYGMSARQQQPHPEAYTAWADWDGIAALRSTLGELSDQHDTLRNHAEIRYWCHAAREADARANADITSITLAADAVQRYQAHIRGLETRLRELDEAAATELRLMIHNELRSITESLPAADAQSVQTQAKRRLAATTEVWEQRSRIQLSQLARDAAAELADWAHRPGTIALDIYLNCLLTDLPHSDAGAAQTLAMNIANQAGMWTPQIATQLFKHHTGMTPVQAQVELGFMNHLQNTDLTSYYSADQLIDMQHHLHDMQLAQVAPLLVQLGTLLWSTASEKKLANQERQRREQLHRKIEAAAKEISNDVLDSGWNSAIQRFLEQLHAQMPPAKLLTTMQDHLTRLADTRKTLGALLKKA